MKFKTNNNDNEELNNSNAFLHFSCSICGRSYPETILNIEGLIHHHTEVKCIDVKSCQRLKRKIKRKK